MPRRCRSGATSNFSDNRLYEEAPASATASQRHRNATPHIGPRTLNDPDLSRLETRLGRLHARQRLGVETDHEAQIFGYGRNFFHLENSRLFALAVEYGLKVTGLYWRGKRNATRVVLRENIVRSAVLPPAFDGYTVLQLSDLHGDASLRAMARVREMIGGLTYDLCVLTGDYRGPTHGPHGPAVKIVAELLPAITTPVFGILGNHDTVRMVPDLEDLGIRMLMNEAAAIERDGARIHVVGVDDPHFYRAENIEKAVATVPDDDFSILLAHTPEIYRQAAHAGFDMMLCGHTHGGQICLPGGIPITLDSELPRRLGAGAWAHHGMAGYTSRGAGTSIVPVRFNCAPEITLHRLEVAR